MEAARNDHKTMQVGSTTGEEGNEKKNEKMLTSASTSTSNIKSNSTTTQSASCSSANAFDGFGQTNNYLRSVLIHPMCFPLVIHLNDISLDKINSKDLLGYVSTVLQDGTKVCGNNRSFRENVFAATMMDWQSGSKTELTEKLLSNLKQLGMSDSMPTVDGETFIVGNQEEECRIVDLIFHEQKRGDNDNKSSVVALFEFGIQNCKWWERQDQILKHVRMLQDGVNNNYKIDQPMLLSVITVNKTTSSNQEEQFSEEEQIHRLRSILKEITEETDTIEKIPLEVRFGVFLCIPKGESEFRIALLWRYDATTLKDASVQFGKLLSTIQLCSFLNNHSDLHDNKKLQYQCLGPNCCKIGDGVFRSYDTRLRPTDRRPDLYLVPMNDVTSNNRIPPIGTSVLEICDSNSSSVEYNKEAIDWLWRYQGELLVISVPYHEGVHYAKHPRHFIPIINHLVHLHSNGYVHGDIRAYNMVLHYDANTSKSDKSAEEGWLIDFDYGGEHKEVNYPNGYKNMLHDGIRPGREGKPITISDDWQSLIGLIFHTHYFVRQKGVELTMEEKSKLFEKKEELESYLAEIDINDPLSSDYQRPATLLTEYIALTSDAYDLALQFKFKNVIVI